MFEHSLYKDKRVLVTGGGTGIGYAIAKAFLQCGARVFIASRKIEKLESAAEQLSEYGELYFASCDIRSREGVHTLSELIAEKCGGLDILINNAGGQFPSLAEDISDKGWDTVINNNLNGTWYVTQKMANTFFIPQKSGRIVNIIMNIYRGFPGMAHSAAARAGVEGLTRTLAVEWSKYQITCNAIAPGIIESSGLAQYPDELKQGIADTIPAKRLGQVVEVAAATLFLCAPLASFITGETLYIDGGQRLWGDMFKF